MDERQHYPWFDRLPEDLRARISHLNRKSAWMHRIIGCVEVTPGVPEAEILWQAVCGLIELNEEPLREIARLHGLVIPKQQIPGEEEMVLVRLDDLENALKHRDWYSIRPWDDQGRERLQADL